MIRSFFHKGLKELFEKGTTARIQKSMHERCVVRLDALDRAARPEDMNAQGFNFHALHGKPRRYSVHVNGPVRGRSIQEARKPRERHAERAAVGQIGPHRMLVKADGVAETVMPGPQDQLSALRDKT